MSKIAILGPIPKDKILTYEGLEVHKYGCVLYPTVALSKLAGPDSIVTPITNIRKEDEAPLKEILAPYKNVNINGLNSEADQGNVIELKYVDQNKRLEFQSAFMNPITPEHVQDVLDADAFVMIPVTDFEISLRTMIYIKKHSKGVTIFDAHGPTNTVTNRGERVHKFWIDKDEWLPYIDILKMNLEEAACSWFSNDLSETYVDENKELPLSELPKFAKHCIDKGVKAVYITLDENGCVVYFKNEAGTVEEHFVERIKVEQVIDTTGCGDSFAGGLAFGYLKTRDYVKACYYANALGAQRCMGTELDVYKSLPETEQQILETYG